MYRKQNEKSRVTGFRCPAGISSEPFLSHDRVLYIPYTRNNTRALMSDLYIERDEIISVLRDFYFNSTSNRNWRIRNIGYYVVVLL